MPDPTQLTTQEKAYLLLAVNSLVGETSSSGVVVEGGEGYADGAFTYTLSEEDLLSGVRFRLTGTTPLFRTVLTRGAPKSAPPAASSRLSVTKQMFTPTGAAVKPETIMQGDRLVVVLTLRPEEKRVNPLIIADLLPAGFEIETLLRPADGQMREYDWRSGEEVVRKGAFSFVGEIARPRSGQAMDDRLVAAIDVAGEPVTIAYVVRAVTPGNFAMPGAVVEDMYRPEVFARSAPGRVTIQTVPASAGGNR